MAGYIGSRASVVSSGAERKKTFDITGTTTSLTGLSYTVNQVHVFHNGVRLVDGTDFTATNGSSITLTSAAESGDEVVVVSYAGYQVSDTVSASAGGTFAGDVTVSGAFTSQGIDDNATSTAMTLDSSGNLLAAKSSQSDGATAGHEFLSDGRFYHTKSGDHVGRLNRLSTDGDILRFAKDGSTVGSIGTAFNFFTVGGGDTGLLFQPAQDSIRPWNTTSNLSKDAAVTLGAAAERFKDLYLSGGVFLGGTGSSNKLDSYEEGVFTAYIIDAAGNPQSGYSYGSQAGSYTKIGNMVNVRIVLGTTGGVSDGSVAYFNLPFTVSNSDQSAYAAVSPLTRYLSFGTNQYPVVEASKGASRMVILKCTSNGSTSTVKNNDLGSSFNLNVSFSYQTA